MSDEICIHRYDSRLSTSVASQAARLHIREIDEGFLSSLGHNFLEMLYTALARSHTAFVITASSNGRLLGFICGSTDTRRTYLDFAVRAGPQAALRLAPKLLSAPRIKRALETLLYPTRRTKISLPRAEILNFCVSSDAQGRGIGRRLFSALTEEFWRRGVAEIRIVTGEEQRRAQKFYDRAGAHRVAELEIHPGTSSAVFIYKISATK